MSEKLEPRVMKDVSSEVRRGRGPLSAGISRLKRFRRRGQAAVESAIVIPLMTFLILGVLQLAMIQHAKLMTDYAAYNAARAGIVWNADRWIMENAAIISLLPTYEGLIDENSMGNPEEMVKQIIQRALFYQLHRRLPEAVDLVRGGTDQLISNLPDILQGPMGNIRDQVLEAGANFVDHSVGNLIAGALGPSDLQMVTVNIISPREASFSRDNTEIDFDNVRGGSGWRDSTRLSIEVQYLYMMRIPFANWIIHQAWRAQRLGVQLYGSIYRATDQATKDQLWADGRTPNLQGGDRLTRQLGRIADQAEVYMIPLTSHHTMRMQSNPYRISLRVR